MQYGWSGRKRSTSKPGPCSTEAKGISDESPRQLQCTGQKRVHPRPSSEEGAVRANTSLALNANHSETGRECDEHGICEPVGESLGVTNTARTMDDCPPKRTLPKRRKIRADEAYGTEGSPGDSATAMPRKGPSAPGMEKEAVRAKHALNATRDANTVYDDHDPCTGHRCSTERPPE